MTNPTNNCQICPRLANFRAENRAEYPTFFNAPVPSFGDLSSQVLVVGLAPGLKGANQTGRPFTGDYAGIILYSSLAKYGFASGAYDVRVDDGFTLKNCRITNAVRCVPPENKPETLEIKNCNAFLRAEIGDMPNLRVILSLGSVSHGAVLQAFGLKPAFAKFAHGSAHKLNDKITLLNTYHSSRYNINTGRLTKEMFDAVVEKASGFIG